MSLRISSSREFADHVRSTPRALVLVYATWCPFCRSFLPRFERAVEGCDQDLVYLCLGEEEQAADDHQVEVYPTLLYFEQGAIARRLDGKLGVGLDLRAAQDFIAACDRGTGTSTMNY
jgi:thiol-disulfide isomerase/thioredoxin